MSSSEFSNYNARLLSYVVSGTENIASSRHESISLAVQQNQLGFQLLRRLENYERCSVCANLMLKASVCTGCKCPKSHVFCCEECNPAPCSVCYEVFKQRIPIEWIDRAIERWSVRCISCDTNCLIGNKLNILQNHYLTSNFCRVKCPHCEVNVLLSFFKAHIVECSGKLFSCPLVEHCVKYTTMPETCTYQGTRDELKAHCTKTRHGVMVEMFLAGMGRHSDADCHLEEDTSAEVSEEDEKEKPRDNSQKKRKRFSHEKKLPEEAVMKAVNEWAKRAYSSSQKSIIGMTSEDAADQFTKDTRVVLYRLKSDAEGERKLLTRGLNGVVVDGRPMVPAPYCTRSGIISLRSKLNHPECSECPYSVGNVRVVCDSCGHDFHLVCAGLDAAPPGKTEWYCKSCASLE